MRRSWDGGASLPDGRCDCSWEPVTGLLLRIIKAATGSGRDQCTCEWSVSGVQRRAGQERSTHSSRPLPSESTEPRSYFFILYIYIFLGGCTGSACGIIIPQPGIESTPPSLEGRVLTTGPPGRCQQSPFLRERESVSQLVCPTPGIRQAVYGILQARILESVAMPSSRGSSQPRDQTLVSCTAGRFFTI